jgi:hypothetical protein
VTGPAGGAASPQDGPGSLAEEAARLLVAAQDWFRRSAPATGAAECAWCPLCVLIAALRSDGGELSERFGDLQAAVTGLLRSLADVASMAWPEPASHPDDVAHPPTADPRVHRIDLSGEA